MSELERGQSGLAGEYAVMSELIFNGFAAGMTGGNSKEIDILCRDIKTGKATNIQVKTQAPDVIYKQGQVYAFLIGDSSKEQGYEKLIETIESKQIYYAFYLAAQKRTFIATPAEVIKQIRDKATSSDKGWVYFRIVDDKNVITSESNYDLSPDFEGEKAWNKLR